MPTKPKGFTLIELLTVVAIIGILAAILIPAVAAAKNAANRAKTRSQLTQWATAMTSFKQEYGYYPVISTDSKVVASTTAGSDKFSPALCGKATINGDAIGGTPTAANTGGNIKLIAFYTITSGDLDTTVTPQVLVDGFGNVDIAVQVDMNGDGKIDSDDTNQVAWPTVQGGNPAAGTAFYVTKADPTGAGSTKGTVRAGVVFYTAGRGITDTDIVTTWK